MIGERVVAVIVRGRLVGKAEKGLLFNHQDFKLVSRSQKGLNSFHRKTLNRQYILIFIIE